MSTGDVGLVLLRLIVGLTFAAHGAQKAFGWWSGPGFVGWKNVVERMEMRPAGFWALVSIAAELGAGLLLAAGLLTPVATAALIGQLLVIIGRVHLPKGFWNKDSGIEFPLSLLGGVLAVAGTGPGRISLDAAVGLTVPTTVQLVLAFLGVAGGVIALELPRIAVPRHHPTATQSR